MQKMDILNNAVLHCVAHCVTGPGMLDTCNEISNGKDKDGAYSIEFKVNGVELDFIKFLDVLHSQYNHKVRIAALEMMKDKFGDISYEFDNIIELLTNTQEAIKKEMSE